MNMEFSHQAGTVGIYRFGTDIEQFGDIFRTQAVDQVIKHLRFPLA